MALLIYIYDLLLIGTSEITIQEVKWFLDSEFTIKDLRPSRYFLGIEIARSAIGTYVNQRKYAMDIVIDTCL